MLRVLWLVDEFLRHVMTVVSVRPYPGQNKMIITSKSQLRGLGGLIFRKTREAVDRVEEAITAWVKTNDMSLRSLVELDEEAFELRKKTLIHDIEQAARDFQLDTDFTKERRMALSGKI